MLINNHVANTTGISIFIKSYTQISVCELYHHNYLYGIPEIINFVLKIMIFFKFSILKTLKVEDMQ